MFRESYASITQRPLTATLILASGVCVGPFTTRAELSGSYCAPWHGHCKSLAAGEYETVQPWCVQIAE